MSKQEFGPLRSRASRKPWPECPDIAIYRCEHCCGLYQKLGYKEPVHEPVCCAAPMVRLEPLQLKDMPPGIHVDYKVVGGFNHNAVQVLWETGHPETESRPEWVLLKTFSGSYIKYLTAKKLPPVVFPLADEDAYVYCDRPVCERCVFRCKRGFVLYLYFKAEGLLEVPLDRMADYFQAKS